MNRFSPPKHLLFYIVVMAVVLVMFQWVSTYGESSLKAPPNLNGRYLSASVPPGCPNTDRLVLTIQQSGIYLHGSVNLEQASAIQSAPGSEATSEEKPSLTGLWQPEQLTLVGKTNALATCMNGGAGNADPRDIATVAVQGLVTVSPKAAFTGHLSLEGSSQPWQFTAQRQIPVKSTIELTDFSSSGLIPTVQFCHPIL
ncbi:MAG: hypothetical protein HC772_09895 [Leptolyngbyaceae cyanobacterium CRU_2_3]|nr:hypothetical protein [Leptolyngbyaceae cyanobacterium CRU_2_3]